MTTARSVAFLSYAHGDDEAGEVTRLCDGLTSALRSYAGDDKLEIFRDGASIAWGDDWRDRITSALDEVIVFIPIMSPRYLSSSPCREEAETFLARGRELGRRDLILPVRFIDYRMRAEADEDARVLVQALERYQYEDWSKLRWKSTSSAKQRAALDRLGQRIAAAVFRAERARTSGESAEPIYMTPPTDDDLDAEALPDSWVGTGDVRPGEGEVFEVFLKEGVTYAVQVVPRDDLADLDVTVFDDGGQIVAQDEKPDSSAYCQVTPVESGLFQIEVTSADRASDYELLVAPADPPEEDPDDDLEPIGGGHISEGEIQHFDLTLSGGVVTRIVVYPDDPSVDLDLAVYDTNGDMVAVDEDTAPDAVCDLRAAVATPVLLAIRAARGSGHYSIAVLELAAG